ncbi:MAG TPA: YdeI/OmpD-associated family protein [Ohtaekwangia sp.]|uniref:YdeI/OmpD-associated family protein n=1 Tax=Ohtaekwangia sp. TaxID=2066019 RepID=UPI002F94FFD6
MDTRIEEYWPTWVLAAMLYLVRKDIRASIGKKVGDIVTVEIDLDTEERVVDVPDELKKALSKNAAAKKIFESLSYTNRKEYANWIRDAKKEETRNKRLAAIIEKLLAGKKNPSEK